MFRQSCLFYEKLQKLVPLSEKRANFESCQKKPATLVSQVGECLWAFDRGFKDPQHEVLDSLHAMCFHGHVPQHAPFASIWLRCEQAPRNTSRPRCLAAAMPPPMQGQRNAASPGSAHLWQPGQTIGSPRSAWRALPRWTCCPAAELSSSGSCSSLKATKHLTKLASTSSTEIKPSWASTCSVANGATGQPLFIWQWETFLFRASGATTASARQTRSRFRQGFSWRLVRPSFLFDQVSCSRINPIDPVRLKTCF